MVQKAGIKAGMGRPFPHLRFRFVPLRLGTRGIGPRGVLGEVSEGLALRGKFRGLVAAAARGRVHFTLGGGSVARGFENPLAGNNAETPQEGPYGFE